jgi:mannonate dehydratase
VRVGIGLYRSMLNENGFRFAAQVGATDLVVHLTDYMRGATADRTPFSRWGYAANDRDLWSVDDLQRLVKAATDSGLRIAAIENLDPGFWSDVLLGGPARNRQLDGLKRLIRDVGRVGISAIGYYFALAGPWGMTPSRGARGGAESLGFDAKAIPAGGLPSSEVWNMVVDPTKTGYRRPIDRDELWERLDVFLQACVPVAEEAGVRLAAHPDDPPVPELRSNPRLLYRPEHFDDLLDLYPSTANALEFCQGTITEMLPGVDHVYQAIEKHAQRGSIAYVHFRNVRGAVPQYQEEFVDSGDVDPVRALRTYYDCGYRGVLIPDHAPAVDCGAPWEAGMAHAVGFLRGAIATLTSDDH